MNTMNNRLVTLLLAIPYGFVLTRSGAIDYTNIREMFLFQSFHMFGFLFSGIGTIVLVFYALKKMGAHSPGGVLFTPKKRNIQPGNLPGGILFGIGWAITGACPGTSFAQVGSGMWLALATVLGLGIGVLGYRKIHTRFFSWQVDNC